VYDATYQETKLLVYGIDTLDEIQHDQVPLPIWAKQFHEVFRLILIDLSVLIQSKECDCLELENRLRWLTHQ